MSLEGISSKNKQLTTTSHEKMTHLTNNCVNVKELVDRFYVKTELTDVIYEHCSKLSYNISKAKFENHQSVLKQPINLGIFLQRSEYTGIRYEYCKHKTKISLTLQYSMYFSDKHDEVVYIMISIKIHVGKDMDSGHYVWDILDYNTGTW